jgi:hypothetical protein
MCVIITMDVRDHHVDGPSPSRKYAVIITCVVDDHHVDPA